jgi:hypothetical protein
LTPCKSAKAANIGVGVTDEAGSTPLLIESVVTRLIDGKPGRRQQSYADRTDLDWRLLAIVAGGLYFVILRSQRQSNFRIFVRPGAALPKLGRHLAENNNASTLKTLTIPVALVRSVWQNMYLQKGTNVAIVVKRAWANLHGVKMFLRHHEGTQADIRGVDESHILFACVLDSEDATGVWIEVQTGPSDQEPAPERVKMLIPWSQVLTIVVSDQFSPAIRQEARRIGFTGETERE